jgi:DNA-repair protein XRCC3
LVVLDSIAGMFRLPDAAKDKQGTAFFARRSEILFGLSAQLRKLGDEYGVAFVVANQVTAGKAASAGNGGGGPRIMGGGGGGGNAIPALGLSWSNCINTRFVLRRSETLSSRMGVSSSGSRSGSGSGATNANGTQQQNQQAQAPVSMFKRWARVAKSPVLPPVFVPFAIDVRGGVATENPK